MSSSESEIKGTNLCTQDTFEVVHKHQTKNVRFLFGVVFALCFFFSAPHAHAAIQFVGSTTASGTNTAYNMSLTSLAGGIGSAPAQGDIVIVLNSQVATSTFNSGVGTAGYTSIVNPSGDDTYLSRGALYYKVMGASPDTTVSCNGSYDAANASACVALVFRGVDTQVPIDSMVSNISGANGDDIDCGSITPSRVGSVVVCAGNGSGTSLDTTPTMISGYIGAYIQTDSTNATAATLSYKNWISGAEDPAAFVMDLGTAGSNAWGAYTFALLPQPTTTVAQGTDPSSLTIAPGATATSTGAFTFQTSSSTEVITALVLNLSNASSTSKVEITSDDGSIVYGSSTNPTGAATTSITLNNSILTANTSLTQYKIRITPKTQANMPSGTLGMLYPITASVNTWTATNTTRVNTDVASTTLTIDNEAGATTQNTGVTWVGRTNTSNYWWDSVTYGNGVFVAVACGIYSACDSTHVGNRVMTSPDGVTWTDRTDSADKQWSSVSFGNGIFVAVSSDGYVMTSPNGTTWTSRTAAAANTWNSVTYGNGLFVAVSSSGTYRVMTSPDGITWTSRTAAAANTWNSVTYGNGLFVAVSSNGYVMTSPNGITWTSRTTAAANTWNSVTYGNGLFVAVSSSGTYRVMTSPDGIIWTSRTAAAAYDWNSVTYGNGLFVAVACYTSVTACDSSSQEATRVMTSSDGITWTSRVGSAANSWKSVTYGRGTFVAVSLDGTTNHIMTSTSTLPEVTAGDTQATVTYTTPGDSDITSMVVLRSTSAVVAVPAEGTVYTGGETIGASTVGCVDTTIATSTADSCTVTGLTNSTPYYFKVFSMDAYGNYSTGLTASGSPVTPIPITRVTQGTESSNITIAPGATATSTNTFIFKTDVGTDVITALVLNLSNASSTSKVEITSDDGATVYGSSTNPTGAATTSITLNNSTLTANTSLTQYRIRITPKTQANMPSGTLGMLYPITASVNTWTGTNATKVNTDVASTTLTIDNEAGATTQNTGVTWVGRTNTSNYWWDSVTYGNGVFVAVACGIYSACDTSSGNRVMSSPDGITWTDRTDSADKQWSSVSFGNGIFVAVSSDGYVMTSPNGTTWTSRTAAAANSWNSVTYGNGLFVAVSSSGTDRVMTSPDGITWTSRTAAAANTWNSVTYGNGLFVAVSSSGTYRVMTSPDGITWTSRTAAAAYDWNSATYGNGLYVAVSSSGVMTSPDGITWTSRTSAANYTWNSVTYGNGLFVAVACYTSVTACDSSSNVSRVMTSPNGITWTSRTDAADYSWKSVTYGRGTFVAVSLDGTTNHIMTSTSTLPEVTAGDTQATVTYTTPGDSDITSMVVLRSTSAVVAVPAEGTVYTGGETIGASTVGCVDTTIATSTADSCTVTGLTNSTPYYFKVFSMDAYGNYSAGLTASGSPVTPSIRTTVAQGTDPSSLTIAPGATATSTGAFTFQTSSGTDVITALVLNLSNASSTSKVEITSDDGATVYGSSTNPTGAATTSITLNNSTLTANTSLTQYRIRITPKTQANMPSGTLGMLYPITASVNTWTGTNATKVNTDVASTTLTIDNEAGATTLNTGVTWVGRANASDYWWDSVTYGNGVFVAVACGTTAFGYSCDSDVGNRVMSSPDAVTWTSRTDAADNQWTSVTFGNGLFVAVSSSGSGNRVMTSPNGITWTSRTSAANNSWTSVTYGNGLFVAVSSSGTDRVMTSPDGITWTSRTAAAANTWNSVTYGNGLFVAVACGTTGGCDTNSGNRVMTSPDGITWTSRTDAADNQWTSVAYGNGLFVAVSNTGFGNRVMTSPDGITWTSRTSAVVEASEAWTSVTYGNGLFIAISPASRMTSPDGITWTPGIASGGSDGVSVTYGRGIFVSIFNDGDVAYSTSTLPEVTAGGSSAIVTYTTPGDSDITSMIVLRSTSAVVAVPAEGTVYTGGETIGASTVGCVDTTIATSTADSCTVTGLSNGTAYHFKVFSMDSYGNYSAGLTASGSPVTPVLTTRVTQGTESSNITIAPGATATSTNTFIFKTDTGTDVITALVLNLSNASSTSKVEITSDDGATVYGSSTNPTGAATTSITLNNSTLTANTSLTQYRIRITPKTQANMPSGTLGMLYPVTATVNTWTGTNSNKVNTDIASTILTIDNEAGATTQNTGVTWVGRTSAANNTWNSVTYGNGRFVAVSSDGTNRMMTSSDGVTWTSGTASGTAVTYGNGIFVAVASSGNNQVMTSPNGTTWTLRTAATADTWTSVTYGNGIFVAVSSNGYVMTSPNGIAWTSRGRIANYSWSSVTYGNGLYVAVSSDGNVMTSSDGTTWTLRTAAALNTWNSVTYGNGIFVAVSSDGTYRVMTSPNGITWTSRSAAAASIWQSVTYGNGIFVAVGCIDFFGSCTDSTGTTVMTSLNGTTWTSRTSAADNQWTSVTYGNGIFVAVSTSGSGNRVMTSTSTLPEVTAGDTQATVTYTTPGDSDITSMVVLRSTSAVVAVPAEGTVYTGGETIGASTVGCVDTTIATSTADSCTVTGLTNSTPYYFKVFSMDAYGNYSAGLTASGSPVTPIPITRVTQGTESSNITIAPGATATSTNTFIFKTDTGTDVITALVLNLSNASSTSKVEITSDDGATVYGSSTNPTGAATTSITLNNSTLTANTSLTQYRIRITPKTQANMPSGTLGMLYPITASVNTWTGTNANKVNTDVASSTLTIDNYVVPNFGIVVASTTFATAVEYAVNTNPDAVATADFNGDGYADIATPDYTTADVSVLLNNGDGTFATQAAYTAGADSYDIDASDFNNDGFPDLFIPSYSSQTVSVLLNNGDGTFATKVDYPTTGISAAYSASAGDLNGDGFNDIIASGGSSSGFVILFNNGDGTFATEVDYTTGSYHIGITITDFNGDGYNDIATSNYYYATVDVLLNNGDGTFATRVEYVVDSTSHSVGSITSGDYNNDGYIDIISANYDTYGISVLLNNGNGTFASYVQYGTTYMYGLTSADLNNDGFLDVITSDYYGGSTVFMNSGTGTFTELGHYGGSADGRNSATADFNNDGKTDIVLPYQTNGTVSTLLNSSPTLTATAGTNQVTIAYITPPDTDIHSILILASTTAVTGVPTDGMTYAKGDALGNATVACIDTTVATSTADSCVATGLTGGTPYYFKAFVLDNYGNYSTYVEPTPNPVTSDVSLIPTLSSGSNQTFSYGQSAALISPITITEAGVSSITAANDIRIKIATSTVRMLWDTTDTTATLTGTASGKVSTSVSYEGGGSVLVLNVTNNVAANETLIVDGLSFTNFNGINTATTALQMYTGGASDVVADDADNRTVTITGLLTLAEHSDGQVSNMFMSSNITDAALYAFRLTGAGEDVNITSIVFPIRGIRGLLQDDFTNVTLYKDTNSNGAHDGGDTQVGGTGVVLVSEQTATVAFSTSFNVSSTTPADYILVGDLANLRVTDSINLSLEGSDMTSVGVTLGLPITETGSITRKQHMRGSGGAGGTSGAVDGDAPEGQGQVGGGGHGGGGGIDPNSGDTIGNEAGFNAPSSQGDPNSEWVGGTNAYVSDGIYTSSGGSSASTHSYGNFGFNIPPSNVITGIAVKLEASWAVLAGGTISVRLSSNGGGKGSDSDLKTTGVLTSTDTVYTLGSSGELWGLSWAPADFDDGTFFIDVIGNPDLGPTKRIDAIQVKVYHQASGGGGGGGGAVFKQPDRYFASAYTAVSGVGNFWMNIYAWVRRWI